MLENSEWSSSLTSPLPSLLWPCSIAVLDANNDEVIAQLQSVLFEGTEVWRKFPIKFTPTVDSVKIRMFTPVFTASVWFDDVSICETA
jgi:hypothetical protein